MVMEVSQLLKEPSFKHLKGELVYQRVLTNKLKLKNTTANYINRIPHAEDYIDYI